ncbi:hypothetical protein ALC62_01438 [Cyphomyrmex costatus]|uniref:Uncharacterized protein n=1 Tax=Cyphomyrmex costatus TaxID=456900 RepID=A0A195D404_9HYME|nr:hypothetical protein ALC62_01438 [Cyphomyrmex costatus]
MENIVQSDVHVEFYVEAIVDALCKFHRMIIATGYSTMDPLPAGSFVFIQGAASICHTVLNLCHLTHMALHATVTSDCQNFQSLNMPLDQPSRV